MTFSMVDNLDKLREIRIHQILDVKDNGRRLALRCPFHTEHTPSFILYPDNSYHCFGCGVHGNNAIDFLEKAGFKFTDIVATLKTYL